MHQNVISSEKFDFLGGRGEVWRGLAPSPHHLLASPQQASMIRPSVPQDSSMQIDANDTEVYT